MTTPTCVHIAGVPIQLMRLQESLDSVVTRIESEPARVVFINAHCVNTARINASYLEAVKEAEFAFNDGAGIEIAAKILGSPVKENLNGTDWIPLFLDRMAASGNESRLFFLGSRPEVVAAHEDLLAHRWPGLKVVGCHHGYYDQDGPILDKIRKAQPHILLIGMGVPRQELFLHRHWPTLKAIGVRVGIAGGAIFDFLSGTVPRAPNWMRTLRLEWIYRFWIEPQRMWRRYFVGLFSFGWLIMSEWILKLTKRPALKETDDK